MIYLILSIICSSAIFILFKLYAKYNINGFQAIVSNYLVCVCLGFFLSSDNNEIIILFSNPVILCFSIVLGIIFIFCFNLINLSSIYVGAAITAIAGKISLIIPVLFAFLFLNESLGLYRIIGIMLAILSIVLISPKQKEITLTSKWYYWLPIMVFITGGALDTNVKVLETFFLSNKQFSPFLFLVFSVAFIIGLCSLLCLKLKQSLELDLKSVLAGIILGLPNYGSVYFLIKVLDLPSMESTFIFPINNIGIIILSSFLAWLIMKEEMKKRQYLGLGIAIVSILFISIF